VFVLAGTRITFRVALNPTRNPWSEPIEPATSEEGFVGNAFHSWAGHSALASSGCTPSGTSSRVGSILSHIKAPKTERRFQMAHSRKLMLIAATFVATTCAVHSARSTEPPADLCSLLPAAEVSKTLLRSLCCNKVKGVGTLIALTCVLTLDDPYRFRRSRDAGCFLGLRPRAQELRNERAADAHQQGRRSLSMNADSAKCTLRSRALWRGQ
jgi:hypothetical protein